MTGSTSVAFVRSTVFYIGYITTTLLWGTLCTLLAWMLTYRWRFRVVIGWWTRWVLYWLRITCGVRADIEGLDNIPGEPCIVFCRHESTWETLFLQSLFEPQATLIKRELLWIPAFGWAYALLKPIAIDRRASRSALRHLIREGGKRLAGGTWVVLFPEGTRMPPGEPGDHQSGGSALASATGAPVLPIVHDAGRYWPAHAFLKRPGTVRVRILPTVDTTGLSTKQVNQLLASTMDTALAELYGDRGAVGACAEPAASCADPASS